ncbi:hypothetical protein LOK49_LG09G01061 [Camellia lanceoleosa]|uniref:Uncharacterized protein n=1 Tax=Camellia lanceoleosa TaxID=1840588 RepID=A0ACC0GIG5_9ERIC|nr:hypothetical protein LOK49_LG09G01061 [Camellia lanceoleosa]
MCLKPTHQIKSSQTCHQQWNQSSPSAPSPSLSFSASPHSLSCSISFYPNPNLTAIFNNTEFKILYQQILSVSVPFALGGCYWASWFSCV